MQKKHGILRAPTRPTGIGQAQSKAATKPTLAVGLQNNTKSANVWAYITGLDLNRNNAVFVLRNDGVTAYYPESPSRTLTPLARDCHIKLGGPGTTRTVTIPQLVGGRIWFCVDGQLTFNVNPGPALVEPSVMNPTDPNYYLQWSFAEFTYNKVQLFANITYVDFVGVPVSLALTSNRPDVPPQHVPGMDSSGLEAVCAQLLAQHGVDGADWDKLIVKTASGLANLRALSPNAAIKLFAPSGVDLFPSYYDSYVSAVWQRYALEPLTLNTQAIWGILRGTVIRDDANRTNLGRLTFPGVGAFPPPSTTDIFSCDSGAFGHYATNTEVMGNITARLAAAFNRSTLVSNPNQPDGEAVSRYYRDHPITNHYSRIVHGVNRDGKGYAFPYDDVAPRDEDNVAGVVAGDDPAVFIVAIGGEAVIPPVVGGSRGIWGRLRELLWGDDLLVMDTLRSSIQASNGSRERGGDGVDDHTGLAIPRLVRSPESLVPPATEQAAWRRVEDCVERDADREAEAEGDQTKGEGDTLATEVAGHTGGGLRLRVAAREGLIWRLLWLATLAAGLVGVLYRRTVVAALLMAVGAVGVFF